MTHKKRLTTGNKKVKALLFSMSPIESCLNHKSCASTCYAVKAYRQYPNVKKLWDDNLNLARTDLDQLKSDLVKQLSNTRQTIVRIHQSGDFISQEYITLWEDVAILFPNITFYGYTKVDKILDFTMIDLLPNVNIIRSMIDGKYRNYGNMAYITKLVKKYDGEICPATLVKDDSIKCGLNCFKCMDKNINILFLEH